MARRPSTYQKMGWHKASKEFSRELSDCRESVANLAIDYYYGKGEDALKRISKEEMYPVYTGNLRDSIAVGIYRKSFIRKAIYMYELPGMQKATRPQHSMTRKRIEGYKEAFDALYKNMPKTNGITFKLVVAVPYAEGANIDGPMIRRFRGKDYITHNKKPGYLFKIQGVFEMEMDGAEDGFNQELKKIRIQAQEKKQQQNRSWLKYYGVNI